MVVEGGGSSFKRNLVLAGFVMYWDKNKPITSKENETGEEIEGILVIAHALWP